MPIVVEVTLLGLLSLLPYIVDSIWLLYFTPLPCQHQRLSRIAEKTTFVEVPRIHAELCVGERYLMAEAGFPLCTARMHDAAGTFYGDDMHSNTDGP